ncbi:hypothetical protein GQ457_02G023520 [Hibiscus cannabinus]
MHETNSVGGNPTGDLISGTGGRPPEPLTDLGSLLVLERLTVTPERVVANELRTPPGEASSDLDNLLQASYMEVATKKLVPIGSGGLGFGFDLDMDTMKVLDKDCLVSEEGAFPTIRMIGYNALLNRMHALWKPRRDLQLVDMTNNYYLLRFEDEPDYADVLVDGPWTIYGSYLTVQPWSHSFSTLECYPSKVVVWVWLPGLPYRLAIFVDLNKPLKSCIGIDNFVQNLEYGGLYQICFGYGMYGRAKENCKVNDMGGGGFLLDAGYEPGSPNGRRKGDSKGKSKAKLACGKDLDLLRGKHAMVVNNAAYLASYPDRKSKKVGSKVERTNKTTLVLMDECVSVKIVEHVVGNGTEGHKAISIVEPGFEGSNCPIVRVLGIITPPQNMGGRYTRRAFKSVNPRITVSYLRRPRRMANHLSQVVASSLDALHPLQGARDTYDVNSSDDSYPEDGVDHMDDALVQDSFA